MSSFLPAVPKTSSVSPASFATFGDLLKFLRRRAGLTQSDLALAVGYHFTQLSKLEHNQRLPDKATLLARFIPVLQLEAEPLWAARLLELAKDGRAPTEGTAAAKGEPPLAPAALARPLPAPLTSFVGRDQVVAAIVAQLHEPSVRLLTLLGPSGIGKTRLALQVAAQLEAGTSDGAVFIPLDAVSTPIQVPLAIADALGVVEGGGRSLHQNLAAYVRDKQLLLVLDNLEQVVEAAPFITDLLESAPRLKVLVTSREVLDVYGERRFVVPPLEVPDLLNLPRLEALSQVAAIALFCQRAQAIKSSFQLTEANARAVTEVCARLDGLPLAIELAAGRINLFSPQAMLTQLNNRVQWLAVHSRNLPLRQQTLWGAISWSYDLLNPLEQMLFSLLAVFAGGFDLEAARAVAHAHPPLQSVEVADLIASLVNQSLVWQTDDEDGNLRFSMLETIHEFALRQLETNASVYELALAEHAAHYLALAELAATQLPGSDRVIWLERLEAEHGNFRAALRFLLILSDPAPEAGTRLALALWNFWLMRGHLSDGRLWLEAAFATAPDHYRLQLARQLGEACWNLGDYAVARSYLEQAVQLARQQPAAQYETLADTLNLLGRVAKDTGQYTDSKKYLAEGLALAREHGEAAALINLLRNLGNVSIDLGQLDEARAYFSESLSLARKHNDRVGIGGALNNLGIVALTLKDYVTAETYFSECHILFQQERMHFALALVSVNRGRVAQAQGRLAEARAFFEQSLASAQAVGKKWSVAYALSNLGLLECDLEQYAEAERYFGDSLKVGLEAGAVPRVLDTLGGVALLLARCAQPERAAELASLVTSHPGAEHEAVDRAQPLLAELHTLLPEEVMKAALDRGRELNWEDTARQVIASFLQPIRIKTSSFNP